MAREDKTKAGGSPAILAYKGFDVNLRCKGFQFEIGATFTHEGPLVLGKSGFHACKNPLAVFELYPPSNDRCRYAEVRLSGEILDPDGAFATIVASEIEIVAELSVAEMVRRAERFQENANPQNSSARMIWLGAAIAVGDRDVASATGLRGTAIAAGKGGHASSAGELGTALAVGENGVAAATASGEATGKYGVALATEYKGVASSIGEGGVALATGFRGLAMATGKNGHAAATGARGLVIAPKGNSLFAREFDQEGNLISVACGIAGQDGIKPDTWYRCYGGKLVEPCP